MAMIKCPECGKEISNKASTCPNCGFKVKKRNKKIIILLVIIIIIIALLIFGKLLVNRSKNKEVSIQNKGQSNGEQIDKISDKQEITEGFEEDKKQNTTIRKDQLIEVKDNCEFTITGYTVDPVIEPPSPKDYYSYFEADAGNAFVDVKMNIKNLKSTSVAQDAVLDSVKIYYDDTYEYYCSFVTEEDNGGDFNQFTTLYSIDPLQTMTYHMLTSVPEEVKDSSKSLYVVVDVEGKEYKCILR